MLRCPLNRRGALTRERRRGLIPMGMKLRTTAGRAAAAGCRKLQRTAMTRSVSQCVWLLSKEPRSGKVAGRYVREIYVSFWWTPHWGPRCMGLVKAGDHLVCQANGNDPCSQTNQLGRKPAGRTSPSLTRPPRGCPLQHRLGPVGHGGELRRRRTGTGGRSTTSPTAPCGAAPRANPGGCALNRLWRSP